MAAGIEIYLSDGNYLEKLHTSLIQQIKSYISNSNIIYKDNYEYVIIKM